MDRLFVFLGLALVVLLLISIVRKSSLIPVRITIMEYQRGLRYARGRFTGLLEPGQYWILAFRTTITTVDIRRQFVAVQGQEVLSRDGVTIKISLAAEYQVTDPTLAINQVQNYVQALYQEMQLALREVVGAEEIEALLGKRDGIGPRVMEIIADRVRAIGLTLHAVDLKDIMFPGELKKIFAATVKARQEGLAALEKARGETAALRNLANAARMIDQNPNILSLRLLQALGETTGHTILLGLPGGPAIVPVDRKDSKAKINVFGPEEDRT